MSEKASRDVCQCVRTYKATPTPVLSVLSCRMRLHPGSCMSKPPPRTEFVTTADAEKETLVVHLWRAGVIRKSEVDFAA